MSGNSNSIRVFFKKPQQPAHQLGMTRQQIVESRINCAKTMIALGKFKHTIVMFTFSSNYGVIGSFALILKKVKCPQNTFFYLLSLESVRRGGEFEILSFMTAGSSLKDPKSGDPMFMVSLKEIFTIFSELRFTPDIFLRIARAIVPKEYVVVMHKECDEQIPERLFNPFSIPVDYFSVQMGPQKRARSQFSSEPAVEVVDEEKPSKRRRS